MRSILAAAAVVLLAAAHALAQAPSGPEFTVNTLTQSFKTHLALAADGNGTLVLTWDENAGPSTARAVRFTGTGQPVGLDFVVSPSQPGDQVAWRPRVAADQNGGFTIVYGLGGASRSGMFGQRYDASGPVGAELEIHGVGDIVPVTAPAIAGDGGGAFVVASAVRRGFGRADIVARRFVAGGAPLGLEFTVNTQASGYAREPAVAMSPAGAFVVAWREADAGDGPSAIVARRFASGGTPIGGDLQVSAFTTSQLGEPAVAMLPGGAFVAAWMDAGGLPAEVKARRYDASGVPDGPELVVATLDLPVHDAPALATDAKGRFVVAWSDFVFPTAGFTIRARRFGPSGVPVGRVFEVATDTSASVSLPTVAFGPSDGLTVVWSHFVNPLGVDELRGRHLRPLSPRAAVVDPSAGATSNGNGVLEAGETVALRTTWQNHTGGPLALAGQLVSITGPAGATYAAPDDAGVYGNAVPDEAIQECVDCYQVSVSAVAARPLLHWDATALETIDDDAEGHQAWLLHIGDSFADVPRTSAFYRFVETVLHAGVTGGCGGGQYCGASAVTREQMAALVLPAREGPGFRPFPCASAAVRRFADVPATNGFCASIEELARRGVVGGCGGGNYCPNDAVTRDQMSVFLLRTLDPALSPPACTTPVFGDVPASSPFCRWVEELARRGITAGCGGGNYCPTQPVTREQMAVFLTTTFGLTLYGP